MKKRIIDVNSYENGNDKHSQNGIDDRITNHPHYSMNESLRKKIIEGTTIIAMKYDKGVIIGSDRRGSNKYRIIGDEFVKTYPIDDYSAISICGSVTHCMRLVDSFKNTLYRYKLINQRELTYRGKAQILSEIISLNLEEAIAFDAFALPIFAGFNKDPLYHDKNPGFIFSYDPFGGNMNHDKYCTDGSGGDYAESEIERKWRFEMSRKEAIDLLVSALFSASKKDPATSEPGHISFPLLYSIDRSGVKKVAESTIKRSCNKIKRMFKNTKKRSSDKR